MSVRGYGSPPQEVGKLSSDDATPAAIYRLFQELDCHFEAENPDVKVNWVDVPWSAMESKILTAAKTAPDVVNLNPNFASRLATRNAA